MQCLHVRSACALIPHCVLPCFGIQLRLRLCILSIAYAEVSCKRASIQRGRPYTEVIDWRGYNDAHAGFFQYVTVVK